MLNVVLYVVTVAAPIAVATIVLIKQNKKAGNPEN